MESSSLTAEDRLRVDSLRALVRKNLSEYYDTDFNLLRWLQGHPGSVEEVAEKLNDHLKASVDRWTIGVCCKHIQSPRFYEPGFFDLEDMLQHVMQIEKKTGKQASILYVMDLTGLKYNRRLYHLVVGPLRSLAEFMSVHYVELIKYFVLVNAPSFVYALWTAVRPLLPDRTRDKVRILSSSDWRREILEYANAESLPDKWNPPGENIFRSPIESPTPFDENNYCDDNFKIPEGATKIRVAAGKFCYVIRELEAGERLSWWITGDADFGFGVFFTDDRNESDHTVMETIYPCFGWMPGPLIVPLQDSITAEKKGFYKILFTNTRAWWHTLNVTFAVHTDTV